MKNPNTIFTTILLVLACFGPWLKAQALSPAPDGGYPGGNTAEGQSALLSLTTGGFNTAVGYFSLRSDTTGSFNTAIGAGTLLANTADQNTATGTGALFSNTVGFQNTANGAFALFSNTGGNSNTAIGYPALFNNTTGHDNTAVGYALFHNTTGSGNIAVGGALFGNTTGSANIALGNGAGVLVQTADHVICIGDSAQGANVSGTCFIRSIRGVTTINNDAIPVLIDSNDQLGTTSSSGRFKKDINPMGQASEAVLALKPVTFHYKSDKTKRREFGLIAEQVAEVNPDLVVRDKNGEIYTVRYDAVNAMLLNEFLKAHRKIQDQESTIAELKSTVAKQRKDLEASVAQQQTEIQALTASLKVQAAQIQKVSTQFEATKFVPRLVDNDQ